MAKTFDVPFSGDPVSLLQRARDVATLAGANLTGDTSHGNFSGKGVEGHYDVSGQTVHVTIDKKPLIVPDSVVEERLRKFFGNP